MDVPLVVVVQQGVPALRRVVDPRVLHDRQHRRHQQHGGAQHPDDRLAEHQQKIPQADVPAPREHPNNPVQEQKNDLPGEKVVVDGAAHEDHHREHHPAAMVHVFIQRPEQQREKDDRLVKMVEKDVVNRKAGERVQQRADDRIVRVPHVPPQPDVGGQRGAAEFQNQQRAHQVRHHPARERDGQPEKRAAQQVERVRADKIRAEVGRGAPAPVAAAHGVVAHLVEGDLLHVEVPVKQKIAVVEKDERQKEQKRQNQAGEQGLPVIPQLPAALKIFQPRHRAAPLSVSPI